YAGTVAGSIARFLVHYVVGATVWAMYMPETFFGMTMTSPWFYSLLYNGFYMAIDMALCLLVFALLARPMRQYFLAEDIR
ncbi:MAG: energy-coupled thiamine transporter ThiT, partial [Lawsonibacter sp.]